MIRTDKGKFVVVKSKICVDEVHPAHNKFQKDMDSLILPDICIAYRVCLQADRSIDSLSLFLLTQSHST